MRSRYTIQFLLTLVLIAGAFLVLHSSFATPKNARCKESIDACGDKKAGNDKMIWENLSQQFFSSL